jgi:hypothetical protein
MLKYEEINIMNKMVAAVVVVAVAAVAVIGVKIANKSK